MSTGPDRYDGKPFLQLLDCYILDAIGHLDVEAQEELAAMEPELRKTYKLQGGWRDIVAGTMQFPAGMQGAVREMWEKGRERFLAVNGFEPDPGDFTYAFVDNKFPH